MANEKIASDEEFELDALLEADDTSYDVVKAYGKTVVIGSLCSADMIEWLEGNDDKELRRFAGLNLLVKSICSVKRDAAGNVISEKRVAPEERPAAIEKFKRKDARNNGRVIKAILKLNGMDVARAKDALKNVSGEATTAASPSDSQGTLTV